MNDYVQFNIRNTLTYHVPNEEGGSRMTWAHGGDIDSVKHFFGEMVDSPDMCWFRGHLSDIAACRYGQYFGENLHFNGKGGSLEIQVSLYGTEAGEMSLTGQMADRDFSKKFCEEHDLPYARFTIIQGGLL